MNQIMQDTGVRWIVAVDGEVVYTTETDNRSEAVTWAEHNLEQETLQQNSYDIMSTEPETEDFLGVQPY